MSIKIKNKPNKTFLLIRQSVSTVSLRPEMIEFCNAKKDFPFQVDSKQNFFYLLDVIRLANEQKYIVGLNLHLILNEKDTKSHESVVICNSKEELLNELRLPSILFGETDEHVFIYEGKETKTENIHKIISEWQNSIE
jgi:hypothetical protein